MLDLYQVLKSSIYCNKFEFEKTVCLEYSCPLDTETQDYHFHSDILIHVLSGKKTWNTIHGAFTCSAGQTIYLKKGSTILNQFVDEEFCMLGFFLSDKIIAETVNELKGKIAFRRLEDSYEKTAVVVETDTYLESYFQSMLSYFRNEEKPPEHILKLKVKELIMNIINSDEHLAAYFNTLSLSNGPSLSGIMETNFCFNLKLEEYAKLTHRSLSTFKKDFQKHYNETPGKWLQQKRLSYAYNLLQSEDMNVSEVAFNSGFKDISHFSRAFKEQFGNTPSEFKRKIA